MALTDIFTDIADAIREKNGSTTQYKPSEMAEAISNISNTPSSNEIVIEDLTYTIPWVRTNDAADNVNYITKSYYYDTKDCQVGSVPAQSTSSNNARSYIVPNLESEYKYLYLCGDYCTADGIIRVAQLDNDGRLVEFSATLSTDGYIYEKCISSHIFTTNEDATKIQFFARAGNSKWVPASLFKIPKNASIIDMTSSITSFDGVGFNIATSYIGATFSSVTSASSVNYFCNAIPVNEGEHYIFATRTNWTYVAQLAILVMLADDGETIIRVHNPLSNAQGLVAFDFVVPQNVKYIRGYQRQDTTSPSTLFTKLYKIE